MKNVSRVTIPADLLARLNAVLGAYPIFDSRLARLEVLRRGVESLEAEFLPGGRKVVVVDFKRGCVA